jgi:hypothetical protein
VFDVVWKMSFWPEPESHLEGADVD